MVCGAIFYLVLTSQQVGEIEWTPYNESIPAKAVEEKKPVIIDFYADWCGPCLAMEKEVFTDPEVVKLTRNIVTMRLDLSRARPFHDEVMRRYQIRGIPTVVFINGQGVEETGLRTVGFVDKSEFLKRLRSLLEQSPPSKE